MFSSRQVMFSFENNWHIASLDESDTEHITWLSDIIRTCHGNCPGFASLPPTIRLFRFGPVFFEPEIALFDKIALIVCLDLSFDVYDILSPCNIGLLLVWLNDFPYPSKSLSLAPFSFPFSKTVASFLPHSIFPRACIIRGCS